MKPLYSISELSRTFLERVFLVNFKSSRIGEAARSPQTIDFNPVRHRHFWCYNGESKLVIKICLSEHTHGALKLPFILLSILRIAGDPHHLLAGQE